MDLIVSIGGEVKNEKTKNNLDGINKIIAANTNIANCIR